MFEYCEIVRDNVFNRGNILKIPVQNYDLDYYGKEVVNGFHSVFMHTEDYLHFDDSEGGKRGYSGNIKSFYLPWDFDNNGNLEQSRKDTVELCERIMVYDKRNIRIYFSGNKGFHVYYICPAEMMSVTMDEKEIKSACTLMASDLVSFDSKVYNKTGIIRTTNSKHSVSGLYKIPLTFQELRDLSIDEIRELAKTQRKLEYNPSETICSDLLELFENAKKQKDTSTVSVGNCDADELLRGIQYGFEEGERNNKFASLAGLLHSRNLDNNFVYAICSSINNNSSNPLGERELQTIINSICRYRVPERDLPASDEDIVTMADAADSWKRIITNNSYTTFGDRFPHLNDRMKLCIRGDVIGFVASSGTGKTSIGIDLANMEAKLSGKLSLCASLEMSQGGLFFRAATMEAVELASDDDSQYVPSSEVAKMLLDPNYDLRNRVIKHWENMRIVDKGGLSLEKIVEYYERAQEMSDGQFSNLIIDFAQNIDGAENIEKAMVTYRQFKDVAKRLETKLFVLIQTNKTLFDDYTEIQNNHLEGSGKLRQTMDYLIAAWRSRDHKNRLHAKYLKDRWSSVDIKFDFVRQGLKYHTEDYLPDVKLMEGGL